MASIPSFLACPACDSDDLKSHGKDITCGGCQKTYKNHDGITEFFADAHLARIQWQSKFLKYQQQTQRKIEKADKAARQTEILPTTKKRLEEYSSGLKNQLEEIKSLLESFELTDQQQAGLGDLLSQRIASTQHVLSYFTNIFRDWAWDTDENQNACDMVAAAWPKNDAPVAVLGPGSSRLAFDLAQKLKWKSIALIEINPVLLKIAQAMAGGKSLELTELNEFPGKIESLKKKWKLRPLTGNDGATNAAYIWTDGINMPIRKNSALTVFTPWFIDIIPEDFALFARRVNNRLAKGSHWVNFGPLGFGGPENTHTYTAQEIKDMLAATGFEIEDWREHTLPYLNSPLTQQSRSEKVYVWRAVKTKSAKEPPRFHHYPTWLTHHDEPIPRHPDFQKIMFKAQFDAQILGGIDGKLNIKNFADLLAKHSNMPREQAVELLLTFFLNWYESY